MLQATSDGRADLLKKLKPHGGQLFNETTSTGWESKNGQQITSLRRITFSKVYIQRSFQRVKL